jgi:plasmid stabilization system protein ParE
LPWTIQLLPHECCDGSSIPLLGLPFFRTQVVQASLRELESSSFPPYIVIYRVRRDEVDIIAVLHTARRRRS